MRSNLRYGKNQKREDVKSHHYIISFDPRDGPDNGLTVDRAQELGCLLYTSNRHYDFGTAARNYHSDSGYFFLLE